MKKYIVLLVLLSISKVVYSMENKLPSSGEVMLQACKHSKELFDLYNAIATEGAPTPTGKNQSTNEVLTHFHPTIAVAFRIAFDIARRSEGHPDNPRFKNS